MTPYLIVGLLAILFSARLFTRRFYRLRRHRDGRAIRELMTASGFVIVSSGLFMLSASPLFNWPENARVVAGAMTVGAYLVAVFVFDQEDAGDGPT